MFLTITDVVFNILSSILYSWKAVSVNLNITNAIKWNTNESTNIYQSLHCTGSYCKTSPVK